MAADQAGDPQPVRQAADIVPREYQAALFEEAKAGNIIAFLDTGAGKTLISVLLIRHVAPLLRKCAAAAAPAESDGGCARARVLAPLAQRKSKLAFFLAPTVSLVKQQAEVIRGLTDLNVGFLCGEMGVDFWSRDHWRNWLALHECIVLTPQLLLDALRHGFVAMSEIALLIFDEAHHAVKRHPYNLIMQEFYHQAPRVTRPRVIGMTASPVNIRAHHAHERIRMTIYELEANLDAKARA